jgi:hypothetical protein
MIMNRLSTIRLLIPGCIFPGLFMQSVSTALILPDQAKNELAYAMQLLVASGRKTALDIFCQAPCNSSESTSYCVCSNIMCLGIGYLLLSET